MLLALAGQLPGVIPHLPGKGRKGRFSLAFALQFPTFCHSAPPLKPIRKRIRHKFCLFEQQVQPAQSQRGLWLIFCKVADFYADHGSR